MKYSIDLDLCERKGISRHEFFYLMYLAHKENEDEISIINRLSDAGFIIPDTGKISECGFNLCREICLESDNLVPSDNELDGLVEQLQSLFPKGKKDGTNLYWKGNKKEIKTRLQLFFKVFGNKYSKDDIVDAAERYVDYHKGNLSYMRILKYFIMKNTTLKTEDKGYIETISDLATFIENKGQESDIKTDFDVTLV